MRSKSGKSYCIRAGLPLTGEILRILNGEIDSALALLHHSQSGQEKESIHEARKHLKKARAVLRMLECQAAKTPLRVLRYLFRDAARLVAPFRDRDVMKETLESLGEAGLPPFEEAPAADLSGAMREAAILVERSRPLLAELGLSEREGTSLIDEGVAAVLKRGRKTMGQAKRSPDAEHFHEWRKRVKEHWYHVRLLATLDPALHEKREDLLRQLEAVLGEDHNLHLVKTALPQFAKPDRKRLKEVLRERSTALEQQALDLGKQLYRKSDLVLPIPA